MKAMLCVVSIAGLAAPTAGQISVGSADRFEADNEGWRVGNAGVNPTFNPDPSFDGQPGFLRHFSDGAGPNGKWLMWTQQPDWTGDYLSAGVDGISLWADGRTGDDIAFWLGFDGPGGWFFTLGQTIVTADEWQRFEFDLDPNGLIYADGSGGTGNASDTLSDVSRFEIFAGFGPVTYAPRGDLLRAGTSNNVIWFDSIVAVPTPASAGVLLAGAFAACRRRRGN
ncbi:MAG: hypothetical protein AAFR96_13140 [Planctomycetota bacterium]